MNDIVVEVRGGVVETVYTDVPGACVVVVDWDSIEMDDGSGAVESPADEARLADLPPNTRKEYERRRHS